MCSLAATYTGLRMLLRMLQVGDAIARVEQLVLHPLTLASLPRPSTLRVPDPHSPFPLQCVTVRQATHPRVTAIIHEVDRHVDKVEEVHLQGHGVVESSEAHSASHAEYKRGPERLGSPNSKSRMVMS